MTQEETIQYNKRCVDLLPFNYRNQSKYWIIYKYNDNSFFGKNRRYLAVNNLKFHSDWNWIMEVVEAIEKLGYQFDITENEVGINSNIMIIQNISTGGTMNSYNRSYYPTIINISEEEYSKKEAVVEAINQFLIWYEQNK